MALTLLKYLSNRCKVTACNNRTKQLLYWSEYHKTPSLGLFCVHINNLQDRLEFCDITLCGDDTVIFFSSKSFYSIESKLNSDLDKFSKWLISNQLTLNINKAKFIIIGSCQRLKKLNSISITTNDNSISIGEVSSFSCFLVVQVGKFLLIISVIIW